MNKYDLLKQIVCLVEVQAGADFQSYNNKNFYIFIQNTMFWCQFIHYYCTGALLIEDVSRAYTFGVHYRIKPQHIKETFDIIENNSSYFTQKMDISYDSKAGFCTFVFDHFMKYQLLSLEGIRSFEFYRKVMQDKDNPPIIDLASALKEVKELELEAKITFFQMFDFQEDTIHYFNDYSKQYKNIV